jgi:anti-anti-sigma regulatory factor
MNVRIAGSVAYLEGNWTMTGVSANIDSLIHTLDLLESEGKKSFQVHCGQIEEADTSGLQILNAWVESARHRGIELKLVNMTDGMRRAIHELGFSQCFSATYPD